MAKSSTVYRYLPLNPSTHEIRLITLLPPLGPEKNENSNNLTRCKIFKTSLDSRPAYTALSYVWGSRTHPIPIILNDIQVDVTRNLGTALKYIQAQWSGGEAGTGLTLWVDALCINQEDLLERAAQIPLMGRIFAEAERTIAWISDNSRNEVTYSLCLAILQQRLPSEINLTMARMVNGLVTARPQPGSRVPPLLNFDAAGQLAVARLALENSQFWWRSWIVQELVLARDLVFQCPGGVVLPWDKLASGLLHPASNTAHQVSMSDGITYVIAVPRRIHGIVQARAAWLRQDRDNASRDLLSVMNLELAKKATDPRDKIWAFLGISDDGGDLTKVDLTGSVEEVYTSFARNYINKYNSVRFIQSAGMGLNRAWRAAQVERGALQIPSWVPQWYLENPLEAGNRVVLDAYGTVYCASKGLPAAGNTLSSCGNILGIQGVVQFDTIVAMKSREDCHTGHLPTEEYLQWLLDTYRTLRRGHSPSSYPTGEPLLKAYFRTVLLDQFPNTHRRLGSTTTEEFLQLLLVFAMALNELRPFAKSLAPSTGGPDDVWTVTAKSKSNSSGSDGDSGSIVQQHQQEQQERRYVVLEAADIDLGYDLLQPGRQQPNNNNNNNNNIQSGLRHALETWITTLEPGAMLDRTLFMTSKGYVGMCPKRSRCGDLICIVPTCSTPLVLRKMIEKKDVNSNPNADIVDGVTEDREYFHLVGECYVHSVMDGEAVELQSNNPPTTKTELSAVTTRMFELR